MLSWFLFACSGSKDSVGEAETGSIEGLEFLTRGLGLWSGPASQTPLGTFPMMNMDLRPVQDRMLFSRVDLDANNALRFAFYVETLDGTDELVFRNGGLFLGIERDTRASLVDAGEDTWRFCAHDKGCPYVEATFTFEDATHLVMDARVREAPHVYWEAERLEERPGPDPFPVDVEPMGDGSMPFPDMPSLRFTVSWSTPLDAPADLWVVLSAESCDFGGCNVSRSLSVEAPAGATSASVVFTQIHPGDYVTNAILDRDRNMGDLFMPSSGDGVALPNGSVGVEAEGESSGSTTVVYDL